MTPKYPVTFQLVMKMVFLEDCWGCHQLIQRRREGGTQGSMEQLLPDTSISKKCEKGDDLNNYFLLEDRAK